MRRDQILMIWAGGAVLAVLIYLIGPDRFLDSVLHMFETIDYAFRNLAFELGAQAYGVVRAVAIAVYVVFAILAFMASQRGLRGLWALIVISIIVLMLVWRPYSNAAPISHWLLTLALVLFGAVTMTKRLTGPYPNRPPYFPPPGRMP